MFIRSELKEKAKLSIHRNIWICIGVTLVFTLLTSELFGVEVDVETGQSFFRMGLGSAADISLDFIYFEIPTALIALFALITLAFGILVINPLMVGHSRYYLENRIETSRFETLFSAFNKENYWNIVKIMLLREIYLLLWFLLFIIPGIIKAYEYQMIPYILAENPSMESTDVFAMTKMMTNGYKMELFILDFSFFLWALLGIITCGIGMLYVNVYMYATACEAYIFLKECAIKKGYLEPEVSEIEEEEVEYVEPTIDDLH